MMFSPPHGLGAVGETLAGLAMVYAMTAWYAVRRSAERREAPQGSQPRVTLLKPLCGAEADLHDCLRSFCDQHYPDFQIVFGVADAADPAVAVVRRLQAEFPDLDLCLVVDPRQHGASRKVSNLINMMPAVRHDYLVLADSDVTVQRDYLRRVVVPLLDPAVGIVTCAYRGKPRPGFWSVLGALFINEWFMPSVRVAALSGSRDFAFGVTIAIRRQALAGLGGFEAIANQLADDYRLGELTRRAGLLTVLSDVVVATHVDEPSFKSLIRHELRWLKTIRVVRPWGFALSLVTFGVPVAALGGLLAGGSSAALTMLAVTALARLMVHYSVRESTDPAWHWLILPARDMLSVALWALSFVTRRVHWRNDHYQVARDGSAQLVVRI